MLESMSVWLPLLLAAWRFLFSELFFGLISVGIIDVHDVAKLHLEDGVLRVDDLVAGVDVYQAIQSARWRKLVKFVNNQLTTLVLPVVTVIFRLACVTMGNFFARARLSESASVADFLHPSTSPAHSLIVRLAVGKFRTIQFLLFATGEGESEQRESCG